MFDSLTDSNAECFTVYYLAESVIIIFTEFEQKHILHKTAGAPVIVAFFL